MAKRGIVDVRKNIDKKNKTKKKNTIKIFLKRLLFYFLFLGFIALVIWVLFLSDFMKVSNVHIDNGMLGVARIEQLVKKEVDKKIIGYIPKNNLILVSKKKIESSLKNEFKLIDLVEIKKEFPSTILVKVAERQEVFIWCSKEECFLVDKSGTAFYKLDESEKDFFKREKGMVIFNDKSNKQIILNKEVVPESTTLFCRQVIPGIEEELKIKVKREISTPSSMSGEITLETEEGWKVHFNTLEVAKEQVQILKKVLGEEFIKEESVDLEYIDLRLKGKVIYKFRGSEDEDEKEEESSKENSEENPDEKKEKDKEDKKKD